jgi:hypothetical protein
MIERVSHTECVVLDGSFSITESLKLITPNSNSNIVTAELKLHIIKE